MFPLLYFHSCRARRTAEAKQSAPAETNNGIKSIVIYEDPPPYESQTVSLHFGNDMNLGREIPSEMPAFTESNKVMRKILLPFRDDRI